MSKIIYRKDYKKPDFLITNIFLNFNIIDYTKVEINAYLLITPNSKEENVNLELNGEDFVTNYLKLNGNLLKEAKDYEIKDNILTIPTATIKALTNIESTNKIIDKILQTFAAEPTKKEKLQNHKQVSGAAYAANSFKKGLFVLETKVTINPSANTKLMGIYKSQNYLCSQCEPEGFRRITWYLDRPDNMAAWTVAIEGDKTLFPVLLSNGNKIKTEELRNNRHRLIFNDPFNKPSYLFALVAGDFDCLHQTYTTKISNKKVDLYIYTDKGEIAKANYAAESLKRAMEWDEKTYSLEYDLDVFSIVAVRDFNFGAMENKSLNIFNEVYVLANPNLATDIDFIRIEGIIGHEYFHNYTGNRVTCRDWFQLTLKEGLTVFRDHKFTADLHYQDSMRISNVELLRNKQFPEDESPLAHPIRPNSYMEIDNFYTKTVYEKGAEVVRMLETLIGEDNFKKGLALYLNKFDGTAATCEDFLESMEAASGISLKQFKNWYSSKGTPVVSVKTEYNQKQKTFTIKLQQVSNIDQTKNQNKSTLGASKQKTITTLNNLKSPIPNLNSAIPEEYLVIPLKVALLSNNGEMLPLDLANLNVNAKLDSNKEDTIANSIDNKAAANINKIADSINAEASTNAVIKAIPVTEQILILNKGEQQFVFNNVNNEPVLSINRGFSAPVIINYRQNNNELTTLIEYDNDGFIKYDAAKTYLSNIILKVMDTLSSNNLSNTAKIGKLLNIQEIQSFIKQQAPFLTTELFLPFNKVLSNVITAKKPNFSNIYLTSILISLPSFEDIAKRFTSNLPLWNVYNALAITKVAVAINLEQNLLAAINTLEDNPNSIAKEDYAKRALKNIALSYLVSLQQEQYFKLAENYYHSSQNMTKRIAALLAVKDYTGAAARINLFNSFLHEYKNEPIVVNKYLALEAQTLDCDLLDKIKSLIQNKEIFTFNNPNKVWSLLGSFAFSNHLLFHQENGESYSFLADCIKKLDKINSGVAAQLATAFSSLKKYPSKNQNLMLQYINKILDTTELSKGVVEILQKIIGDGNEN